VQTCDHPELEGRPQGSLLTSRAGLVLRGFLVVGDRATYYRTPRARPQCPRMAAAIGLSSHASVHASRTWRLWGSCRMGFEKAQAMNRDLAVLFAEV